MFFFIFVLIENYFIVVIGFLVPVVVAGAMAADFPVVAAGSLAVVTGGGEGVSDRPAVVPVVSFGCAGVLFRLRRMVPRLLSDVAQRGSDGGAEFAVLGNDELYAVYLFHGRKYGVALWQECQVAYENVLFDAAAQR